MTLYTSNKTATQVSPHDNDTTMQALKPAGEQACDQVLHEGSTHENAGHDSATHPTLASRKHITWPKLIRAKSCRSMATGSPSLGAAFISCRRYLIAALLLAAFGAVYERFSHEVYSPFMVFAFMVPVVLGAIPALISALFEWELPAQPIRTLWGAGVAMLAVGSVMQGVLEIFGTTNSKLIIYPVVGMALLIAAIVWRLANRFFDTDR